MYIFFFLPKEKKMPTLQKISRVFWEKKKKSVTLKSIRQLLIK